MNEDRNTELADTLAEAGRRLGQAVTDVLERLRPAWDAVAEVANRPEVKAFAEQAAKVLRHRPCLCMCTRTHPDDRDICEMLDAVITARSASDLLGEIDVPMCAPCAAARAAHHF